VRLHGLLLAFGWLAQNTGHTAPGRPGEVAACYRVTPDGGRTLRQAGSAPTPGNETEAAGSDAALAPSGGDDASPPRRRLRVRNDRSAAIPDAWTTPAAGVLCFRLMHEELRRAG
jgi:hypothetical protein